MTFYTKKCLIAQKGEVSKYSIQMDIGQTKPVQFLCITHKIGALHRHYFSCLHYLCLLPLLLPSTSLPKDSLPTDYSPHDFLSNSLLFPPLNSYLIFYRCFPKKVLIRVKFLQSLDKLIAMQRQKSTVCLLYRFHFQ